MDRIANLKTTSLKELLAWMKLLQQVDSDWGPMWRVPGARSLSFGHEETASAKRAKDDRAKERAAVARLSFQLAVARVRAMSWLRAGLVHTVGRIDRWARPRRWLQWLPGEGAMAPVPASRPRPSLETCRSVAASAPWRRGVWRVLLCVILEGALYSA